MSIFTNFLNLFKWDPTTDGEEEFDINKALNENWDKIDSKMQTYITNLQNSKLDKAGGTLAGPIVFDGNNAGTLILLWNGGTYQQRIKITDDGTTGTAVFEFQQSSNSGSTWDTLFTIRDDKHAIASYFDGALNGNASTSTKLQTPRAINGVNFDGTAAITITANPNSNQLTNEDLNAVTTPGFYFAGGSNTVLNKPSGVDAFGLIVYRSASGSTAQELISTNNNPNAKYIRFLSGNWVQFYSTANPPANATTTSSGLMSSEDKTKLGGVETGANNYVHPTTSGNKHIPSGGSSGQILRWNADGTAVWGADNNTTYSNATQSAAGLMSAADKTKTDAQLVPTVLYNNTNGTVGTVTLSNSLANYLKIEIEYQRTGSYVTNSSIAVINNPNGKIVSLSLNYNPDNTTIQVYDKAITCSGTTITVNRENVVTLAGGTPAASTSIYITKVTGYKL